MGGTVVAAERATETECDVYAPCALGGSLDESTIRGLRCGIVAGAANNQLATPEDADRLAARGIVYAPDFVINAGGALHGAGVELLGWDAVDPRAQARGESARHCSRSTTGRSATARAPPPRPSGSRRSGSPPRPFPNSRERI